MSRFLLDTDTLSLLQYHNSAVLANVPNTPAADIAISSVTIQEQVQGWLAALGRARGPQQLESYHSLVASRLAPTWARFTILPLTQAAILRHDQLRSLRLNVGPMDLRIAAVALEAGVTVVTRNRRDFGRVPGLTIVDWSV